MTQREMTAQSKQFALRLVKNGRREYLPISGEELLCRAAQAAHDVLCGGLARVPISDPLRSELEARVDRLRDPAESALPATR